MSSLDETNVTMSKPLLSEVSVEAVADSGPAQQWRDLPTYLARSLRHHAVFIGLLLAYFLYQYLVTRAFGLEAFDKLSLASYFLSKVTLSFVCIFVAGYFLVAIIRDRPEHLTRYCWAKIKRFILTPERLAMVLPVIILIPMFYSAFSSLKSMIPLIQPFAWDPVFAEWDRIVHFGRHPYEWLAPILAYPWVTRAIYVGYMAWVMVLNGVVLWQTLSLSDVRLRMQFLLSFAVTWIFVGTMGGTLLSSAGPCFYALVTGEPGPYGPLMAYLNSVGETDSFGLLLVQDWLWSTYQEGVAKDYAGISAMPSMHVAMVVLLYLVARRVNRWLGLAFAAFALLIFVGSVHLAWHYAIDGYVSGIATVLIWIGVGALQNRFKVLRSSSEVSRTSPTVAR